MCLRFRIYLCLLCIGLSAHLCADTDRVTFDNGNVLIGEVKRLTRGKLFFKTDATGVVEIDWYKVTSLVSKHQLQLKSLDGQRYLGALGKTSADDSLLVTRLDKSESLPLSEVVEIYPIEGNIRDRFDIAISAGANYNKASDVGQFNLGLDVTYRTEQRYLELNVSSIFTNNKEETTQRQDLKLGLQALREDRWFTGGLFKIQKNEELGLDLRTSFGGGLGRSFLESTTKKLELTGGLLFSREKFINESKTNSTLEGLIIVNYDWFRFTTPQVDINSSMAIFPGITDTGRLRGEIDLTVRWEIVEDFFWELDIYDNYDNEAESKNDYGVTTSLGYKF